MTERETVTPVEQGSDIPFDAIFIHGYWLSESKSGLALRSRLAVRAGALAYDNGKGAKKIFLDQGHLWGHDYLSEGCLMAKELIEKYGVPPEAIIIKGEAYSTGGEVKLFVEQIKLNNWTRVLDIAFAKHLLTIPKIFEKTNTNVEFKSVEEIIEEKDNNPHVKNLIKRFRRSGYEAAFGFYEAAIWAAMRLPGFDYKAFEQSNQHFRTHKSKGSILPLDVFNA
jgi:hypothetical protein